jgi:hypothetical protein
VLSSEIYQSDSYYHYYKKTAKKNHKKSLINLLTTLKITQNTFKNSSTAINKPFKLNESSYFSLHLNAVTLYLIIWRTFLRVWATIWSSTIRSSHSSHFLFLIVIYPKLVWNLSKGKAIRDRKLCHHTSRLFYFLIFTISRGGLAI